jgi:spore coat polysaccharide biosynthesis protein SpsF (cytidylyltransferase family)
MGSSRLPGKVLEDLAGRPALLRIVERLARVQGLDGTVVLTSVADRDDIIARVCAQAGVACLRGSEDDVLDRFVSAARLLEPTEVVRILADNPLIDPEVVDQLLELYHSRPEVVHAGVATGALSPRPALKRFPLGLDAEVDAVSALETAWRESTEAPDREHVTRFIWRNPERFQAVALECDADHGDLRWTVDHPDDLELVRTLYSRLGGDGRSFGWRDVLAELRRDPALVHLNAGHRANRG